MIHGVNGNPYLSLDTELGISDDVYEELWLEICLGLCKVDTWPHTAIPRSMCYMDHHPENPFLFFDIDKTKFVNTPVGKIFPTLTSIEKQKILKYYFGVYFSEDVTYYLTGLDPYQGAYSQRAEPQAWRDDAKQWFPKTIKYIESLPMFEYIGRVAAFGSSPYQPVITHRDRILKSDDKPDYYVHLNLKKKKPFFVFDEETKEKFYTSDSNLIIFNNGDWHGADADTAFTVTLKISGEFKQEWKDRLDYNIPK